MNKDPMTQSANFARHIIGAATAVGIMLGATACAMEGSPRSVGGVPITAEANPGVEGELTHGSDLTDDASTTSTRLGSTSTTRPPASTSSSTSSTSTTELSQDDTAELAELLTIDSTDFECLTDGAETGTITIGHVKDGSELVIPKINALLPLGTDRSQNSKLWGDAVANAMTSDETDPAALLAEFDATMCEDPEVAVMTANYVANMDISGVKVVDQNEEWLGEYAGDPSIINDKAEELVPGYSKPLQTEADTDEAVEANQKHQELAEKLAELLSRFENAGLKTALTTIFNYHLGALSVDNLPEIEVNPNQYTGNFLRLNLTFKDGRCVKALVINTDDQRIGEVADDCVEAPTPTTTTTVHENGTTTTTTVHENGTTTTTTVHEDGTTTTVTILASTTTLSIPEDETTSTRVEVAPPASEVIQGPGAGGTADPDNDPNNNTTIRPVTPTTVPPSATTSAPTSTEAAPDDSTPTGTWIEG